MNIELLGLITMINKQNLIPLNRRTKDEQRAIATQGGIASGKSRQEKKRLRELAEKLLNQKDKSKGMPNDLILVANLIERAKKNDNAFVIVQHLIGEKPTDKVEVKNSEHAEIFKNYVEVLISGKRYNEKE